MSQASTYPDIIAIMGSSGYTPQTIPVIDVPTSAVLDIGLDVSAQLPYLVAPLTYTAKLTDPTGAVIALPAPAGIIWQVITQLVSGASLTPGTGYTLTFSWTDESGLGTSIGIITIRCPF